MRFAIAMLMTLAFSGPVLAADEDRAACMKLSGDERKTCLREAGAARFEAKRNGLADGGEYEKNLTARCNYLPAGDRDDCMRRMRGEGTVTGSVEGGGIYRELRTLVPAPEEGAGSGATK